ncbi:YdcF family protein [Apilactobacillus kunkeei]|uniref:YdcF family protein n=1 Tax=Apilactobacillus kunkeei TaxID=148814 RepID=UPI0006B24FA8|nr:YdcF family protein [Apilactobacillus kunkeei]KOY70564.1 hypothetical protein RZ73_00370 [Apilactobacillus kunkeei]TPR53951.1 hypothetical protein DY036_03840 [Apilactobacillus kunkeei]CAI2605519.1 hypothetical protein AKUFHON2_00420 [Apilactobacillus kunkeei]
MIKQHKYLLLLSTLIFMGQSAISPKFTAHASNETKTKPYNYNFSYKYVLSHIKKDKNNQLKLKAIDKAIKYNYWHKPDFNSTQKIGVTSSSNNEELISLYEKALKISPNNIKYLLGLSSVYQLNGNPKEAQLVLNRIRHLSPSNYQSLLQLAMNNELFKQPKKFATSIRNLNRLNSTKTNKIKKVSQLIKKSLTMNLNQTINNNQKKNDYIIILGFVLNKNGKPQRTLVQRLEKGLTLAKEQPNSKIIVSGGELPVEPKIEATVMKNWLVKHGVASSRIITEEGSLDTVSNALNVTKILNKNHAKHATIVSSASHMRRAYTLFEVAKLVSNGRYGLSQLVSIDKQNSLKPLNESDPAVNKIILDSLRTSGYWLLPNIQR